MPVALAAERGPTVLELEPQSESAIELGSSGPGLSPSVTPSQSPSVTVTVTA